MSRKFHTKVTPTQKISVMRVSVYLVNSFLYLLLYRVLLFRRGCVFNALRRCDRRHLSNRTLLSPGLNFPHSVPWWDVLEHYRYRRFASWKCHLSHIMILKFDMQTLIVILSKKKKKRGRRVWCLPHGDLLSLRRRCPAVSSRTLLSWWWCWGYSALPSWHIQPSVWPQPSRAVPHLSSRWEYCHLVVLTVLWITRKYLMKCSVSWTWI